MLELGSTGKVRTLFHIQDLGCVASVAYPRPTARFPVALNPKP